MTLVKLLQQFDFERPPQVQQKPGCTTESQLERQQVFVYCRRL